MNKTGIKILCLIISAITVLSMFGCSKKPQVSDKDGGLVNVEELTNKDGDIVIKNEVTDKDGNKSEVTQLIDGTSIDTPIYAQSGITKRDNFVSEIAKKSFDMPEETAKSVVENADGWKEFYVSEYIKNTSDKHMAFKSISIENNGENGLWVSKDLDAEFTFAPGTTELLNFWALADCSKLKDGDAIKEALKNTKINLTYTLVDDPMGDINWEKAELKEFVIH